MEKTSKSVTSGTDKKAEFKPVKPNSDAAQGLRELFVDSLKDIYWAEKALTKAIPKMIKNATSEALVEALTMHLEETKQQIERLEEVFAAVDEKAQAKKCDAMKGILKEAEDIIESTVVGVVRDAGIIAAAQKVEHYEIATYGTLCSFAKILGEEEAAFLLEETLEEEKAADITLSEISNSINIDAAEEE